MAAHKYGGSAMARRCTSSLPIIGSRRCQFDLLQAELRSQVSKFPCLPHTWAVTEQQLELAQYAVSPDGNRFLMNAVTQEAHLSPITLVLNWKPH